MMTNPVARVSVKDTSD